MTTGHPGSRPSQCAIVLRPLSCPATHDNTAMTYASHGEMCCRVRGVEPKEETGWDIAQDCCLQTSVGQLHARERYQKDRAYTGESYKRESVAVSAVECFAEYCVFFLKESSRVLSVPS